MSPKMSNAVKYVKKLTHLSKTKNLEDLMQDDFNRLGKESRRQVKSLNYTSALAPENINKNRYSDVLALEDTRIRLSMPEPLAYNNLRFSDDFSTSEDISEEEDDQDHFPPCTFGSDYINANLLTKGRNDTAYIACQAPLPNTMIDFWKMIWEQRLAVIVMLTRLSEKGKVKAHCYWPKLVGRMTVYGNLTITLVEQHPPFQGTIVRLLKIQENTEVRYLYHLHYCDWPDFGTPLSTQGIRTLLSTKDIARARAAQQGCKGPVLIHCSAGLGRAGAFVASDWLLESVLGGKSTQDEIQFVGNPRNRLYSIVTHLRNQRPGMVQTMEQYTFVMAVLYDTISSIQPWTRQN